MKWSGKLLNASGDAKTIKGEKQGYLTAIMYLAPNVIATKKTLCPHATPACIAACLYTAGRGRFSNVQAARVRKSKWFEEDQGDFMQVLALDVDRFNRHAHKRGLIPCVRLNGTSDILFERIPVGGSPNIMRLFPGLQFYDYTKCPPRLRRGCPANYDLTFSQSETNDYAVKQALNDGYRVATVFHERPLTWLGQDVVDGDESDLRFLDPAPCIIGLSAKGAAKQDQSGFVK